MAADQQFLNLLSLARDKTAEGRSALLNAVTDLFENQLDDLSVRERTLANEILDRLIHDVEASVRRALAERLAFHPKAPLNLVKSLANDEADVARPLLINSLALQDPALIEIIQQRSMQHQVAIASRKGISEHVSAALVATGNDDVIETLLGNGDARINRRTFELLAEKSKRVDRLQAPLVRRDDLPPELAKRVYWFVSAALRQHILSHFEIDESELDEAIEHSVRSVAPLDASQNEKVATNVNQLADYLMRVGAVTPKYLIEILRGGQIPLFEALFARLSGLRTDFLNRLLYQPGGEALAIVCRAIKIDKPNFAAIFILSRQARPGDKSVDPQELSRVLDFFDKVKAKAAQNVLRHWQRDPDYLKAIRLLETASASQHGARMASAD